MRNRRFVVMGMVGLLALSLIAAIPLFGTTHFTGVWVLAPTEVATATPVFLIKNSGIANSLEIRKAETPVFYVDVDGNATYTGFSSGGGNVTDAVRIVAPTAVGTATPALVVDSLGAGNVLLDVRDAATPVFSVNNGGGWTSTGAGTHSSGQTVNNWAVVSAPTAIATATPAMVINSLGVSNILEVRDAATPVFSVNNGGAWASIGAGTHSSGQTINNWAVVSAPTAIATATPGMVIDSLGVSNLLEIRDAATPVAAVNNGGNWIIGAADGTGVDMTWYSDTAGDTMLWDQSDEALTITGTNGQDALNVDDGNVDIADNIDVDGTSNLDEVDVDGVLNLVTDVEHVGVPSIETTAITYTAAAGGSGTVATIGDGEVWLVTKVLIDVTESFSATGDDATLIVGDGNDVDGFIVLADAELQAADTEGTGFAAGWQGQAAATIGAYLDANENGFIYAPSGAAETIDYLISESSGDTLDAGAATIYVFYTRLQ